MTNRSGARRTAQSVARSDSAVRIATRDGSIWVGALRPMPTAGERGFKRPALSGGLQRTPAI